MTIIKFSGDLQEQGVANDLQLPLKVLITDTDGSPVPDIDVTFAIDSFPVNATMQNLSSAIATTGSDGTANVVFTLGEVGGIYTVTAAADGLINSPLIFTATGLAISSFIDMKIYMGIAASDTSHDTLIASWLGELTVEIEKRLEQPVMPRNLTEYISGTGETRLYLGKGRIVDLVIDSTGSRLSSLQIRNSVLDTWANLVEDESYIYLDPVYNWRIELLDWRIFPVGIRNIRVYYLAGFNPIPGDLHEMAQQMVQQMWDLSKAGGNPRLGMRSRNINAASASGGDTFKDMEPEWQAVINRYKRTL